MSAKYPGGFITKSPVAPTPSAASGVWTVDQALQYTKAGTWPTPSVYVDDVFSTYLYTGNGSTQTITNGIDLSGQGGMVWAKARSAANAHNVYDTARGASQRLATNVTNAQANTSPAFSSFNSNGFSLNGASDINNSTETVVSWTFRKAAKFFDVVTYTGDGASTKTISHSLGQTPGMIIVKRLDSANDWYVYHRSLSDNSGNPYFVLLNSTAAQDTGGGAWGTPTTTDFTVRLSASNANGGTYVAYLFAHDTAANGIIQCGAVTCNGSAIGTVTLGWEPQYVLIKCTTSAENWLVADQMRGMTVNSTGAAVLFPNTSGAEYVSGVTIQPNATGFTVGASGFTASQTYIYLAIRRPNKPPTTGTQVYNAIARTGTGADATVTGVGFAPDLVFASDRIGTGTGVVWFDRLRGQDIYLRSAVTNAETTGGLGFAVMDGFSVTTSNVPNANGINFINWNIKRAPGVFDVVCYTGTGSATTVAHNLGVAPELIITKSRSNALNWGTFAAPLGNTKHLMLNLTDAVADVGSVMWNSTSPTASVFSVGTGNPNGSGFTYVAYLFATKAGISKVGSYTGNGSSQTINAGFTTGARWVMIKRTDDYGDWFVWDSTRGIVAGNDPHLSLNTTAAEVTTDDSVDTDTSGFIVNQLAATNVNVTSATYIYLAFA